IKRFRRHADSQGSGEMVRDNIAPGIDWSLNRLGLNSEVTDGPLKRLVKPGGREAFPRPARLHEARVGYGLRTLGRLLVAESTWSLRPIRRLHVRSGVGETVGRGRGARSLGGRDLAATTRRRQSSASRLRQLTSKPHHRRGARLARVRALGGTRPGLWL